MTISAVARSVQYLGNGSTTLFAVPFQFRAATDLRVTLIAADGSENVKSLGANYTVSGGGSPPATGSVTMLAAPATGETLVIEGAKPVAQARSWEAGDRFPAEATEGSVDDLTIMAQEARRDISDTRARSLMVQRGQSFAPIDKAAFAGKFYAGDATGDMVPASGTGGGDAALRNDLAADTAGAALVADQDGGSIQQRARQLGVNPDGLGGAAGVPASSAFAAVFARVNDESEPYPTARIGAGAWLTGTAPLTLSNIRAGVRGEGISVTRLHTTVPAGAPAFTFRNYGGVTEHLTIDSGLPEDWETARADVRNGAYFDWTGGHGTVRSIEARWFNGFGLKFSEVWDSIFENIITVGCGNATEAAIQIIAAHGDTINHTNIQRLQPEDSVGIALWIRDSLNLVVDGFHCEGAIGVPDTYTIEMLGGNNSYRNGRIANDGGNVSALLGGGNCCWQDYAWEDGTRVLYSWGASAPEQQSRQIGCRFDDLELPAPNTGRLLLHGCSIGTLRLFDQPGNITPVDCDIGDIEVNGSATVLVLRGCRITGVWTIAGSPTVHCIDCTLTNAPPAAKVVLRNCTVLNDYSTQFNQQLVSQDTSWEGDIVLENNGALVWLLGQTKVAGNLGYTSGNAFGACGEQVQVQASSSVHPNWYGTDGTWPWPVTRWRPKADVADVLFHYFNGTVFVAGPAAA